MIERVFDLQAILEVSIGPTWPKLPPDQQAALRRYSVAPYVDGFDNCNGGCFDMPPETRALGNGDQVVRRRIIPESGETHALDDVIHDLEGDCHNMC